MGWLPGLGLGVLMAIPCKIAFAAAPNALSLYRSLILRPPPTSVAFRSITIMNNRQSHTNAAAVTDIDAIFKQKRALRSRVKKELKNMDPTLRSYEGNHIYIFLYAYVYIRSYIIVQDMLLLYKVHLYA